MASLRGYSYSQSSEAVSVEGGKETAVLVSRNVTMPSESAIVNIQGALRLHIDSDPGAITVRVRRGDGVDGKELHRADGLRAGASFPASMGLMVNASDELRDTVDVQHVITVECEKADGAVTVQQAAMSQFVV